MGPTKPARGRFRFAVALVLFVLVGGIALVIGCAPAPTARVVSAEEELCNRFAKMKNAGDAAAVALLGPAPTLPSEPVTPDEAQRLQTEFFLRGTYQVTQVSPWTPPPGCADTPTRFILVTQGSMSADTIPIQTATGVERANRVVTHPDLLVEVRDGKIFGVRTDLHKDPNERPLTPAEARRLKKILGLPTESR
jgi:hypothetical protein